MSCSRKESCQSLNHPLITQLVKDKSYSPYVTFEAVSATLDPFWTHVAPGPHSCS